MKIIPKVPRIAQMPGFPTGCESAAAAMLCGYLGCPVTLAQFVDEDLDCRPLQRRNGQLYGPDPREAFAGDPRDAQSLGCYAPVIARSLRKVLPPELAIIVGKDRSLEELLRECVDQDMPVILWASLDMKPTFAGPVYRSDRTGEQITWISNEHCLLLVGQEADRLWVHDPWRPEVLTSYDRRLLAQRYQELGCQSIAVRRQAVSA